MGGGGAFRALLGCRCWSWWEFGHQYGAGDVAGSFLGGDDGVVRVWGWTS